MGVRQECYCGSETGVLLWEWDRSVIVGVGRDNSENPLLCHPVVLICWRHLLKYSRGVSRQVCLDRCVFLSRVFSFQVAFSCFCVAAATVTHPQHTGVCVPVWHKRSLTHPQHTEVCVPVWSKRSLIHASGSYFNFAIFTAQAMSNDLSNFNCSSVTMATTARLRK